MELPGGSCGRAFGRRGAAARGARAPLPGVLTVPGPVCPSPGLSLQRAAETPARVGGPGVSPRPAEAEAQAQTDTRASERQTLERPDHLSTPSQQRPPPQGLGDESRRNAGLPVRRAAQRVCAGVPVAVCPRVQIHSRRECSHEREQGLALGYVLAGRPACGVHGCERWGGCWHACVAGLRTLPLFPPLLPRRPCGTVGEQGRTQVRSCPHGAVGKGGQSYGGVSSSPINFPPPGPLNGRWSQSLGQGTGGVQVGVCVCVSACVSLFGILLHLHSASGL